MKLLYTLFFSIALFSLNAQIDQHQPGDIQRLPDNTGPAQLQPEPKVANPNAPKIQFKTTEFEFGTIPEGPQAKHEFEFTNTGKEPLTVTSCQASCGCTVPQCPRDPILPGQTGKITAIYNTQGRVGPFNKSITIMSNSEGMPVIVYIKGVVKETPPEQTMPINDNGNMMIGN